MLAHGIRQRAERIVQNEQVLLLVLLERKGQVAQNGVEERRELGSGFFFESGECGTAGFLDALVAVEDATEQLYVSITGTSEGGWVREGVFERYQRYIWGGGMTRVREKDRRTPSMVGKKYWLLSCIETCTIQDENRPSVQQVMERTSACRISSALVRLQMRTVTPQMQQQLSGIGCTDGR